MVKIKKEKVIESHLEKEIRSVGGRALKLNCMGLSGFPDRTLLLPGGYIVFAECKREGEDLRKLQVWVRDRILTPLGFKVYTVRNSDDIRLILDEYKGAMHG